MLEVRLTVAGFRDSDPDEQAELARRLKNELRELDVADISSPRGVPPAGSKGDAVQWAQLVVTLAGSLPPLIAAVQGWRRRHPGASVTVEIDGDKVTLDDSTEEERRELIATWMTRHGK